MQTSPENQGKNISQENISLSSGQPESPVLPNKYIVQEETLKVLSELGVDDRDVVDGIVANNELADLVHIAHKNGRTFGPGFYFDIQKIDQGLARKFAKQLDENGFLPELSLTDVHIPAAGSNEDEVVAAHKISILRGGCSLEGSRDKTQEEKVMIGRASEYVNSLRARFSLPSKIISEDTVTMIPHGVASGSIGGYSVEQERAKIRGVQHELARFDLVQHELLHAAGFNAIKGNDGPRGVEMYRSGVSITSQKKKQENGEALQLLDPLNEAITEELSRRGVIALTEDDQDFGDMVKERMKGLEDMEKVRARGNNLPQQEILNEELLYVRVDFDKKTIDQEFAGYSSERRSMWKLFEKMYEKKPTKFVGKTKEQAMEELFDVASKAYFTGNLLPLGRIVNEVFGKGSFKEYGHFQTAEEISQFLDTR